LLPLLQKMFENNDCIAHLSSLLLKYPSYLKFLVTMQILQRLLSRTCFACH